MNKGGGKNVFIEAFDIMETRICQVRVNVLDIIGIVPGMNVSGFEWLILLLSIRPTQNEKKCNFSHENCQNSEPCRPE